MCDLAPNKCCLQFVITCHLGGVGSLNMDWLTAALSLFVMYMNISVMIESKYKVNIYIDKAEQLSRILFNIYKDIPDGMHVAFVFAEK